MVTRLRKWRLRGVVALVGMLTLLRPALAATPEQIEKSIRRGVENLYSLQEPDGSWEPKPGPPPAGAPPEEVHWGGYTALCVYALLAAGEKPNDPRISKAVEWLRKAPIISTYAYGMRANVWLNLPQTDANKACLIKDGKYLYTTVTKTGPGTGFYDYVAEQKFGRIDCSVGQYGVLGAWAAQQRMDVQPKDYWPMVEKAWQAQQNPDGGWAYTGKLKYAKECTMQMTAAGVATLFITQEFVHADEGIEGTRGNVTNPAIDKGLDWMVKHLPESIKNPYPYAMYGLERVGVASGYKYFGDIDWFQKGADALMSTQRADGSWRGVWSPTTDTCLSLLFLARGRAPVIMNKLQYNLTSPDGKTKEGNWNQRSRDVTYTTRFVQDVTERPLNWQIINLKIATIADLHDSGLLYISGNQTLAFTDAEKALLKQYIDEGGLIIGNADVGKAEFVKAFRDLAREWFPTYEFSTLSAKDAGPLMNGQQFKASAWKKMPRIEAMGNGARTLMILIPSDDFSRTMQKRDMKNREVFEFFANAFFYTTERDKPRYKGETHVVRADPAVATTGTVRVARLKYPGNWNPEPGGWSRLAAVMHNEDKLDLETKIVDLGVDSLDGFKFAHLTGTGAFALDDKQKKALADFVQAGGVLIVDACGGSKEFDTAATRELTKIFPDQAVQLAEPLKPTHPLFAAAPGGPLEAKYRVYTLIKLGAQAAGFRVKGIEINNKLAALYSPEDLSTALVGVPTDGIIGYAPETATALMRRVLTMK